MILRRLYDPKLAQASYLVACGRTGEALVIDPNRDCEQYLEAARAENVRITHVTETHIHADFVSGSRELAAQTGARLLLSDAAGDAWRYAFAKESDAVPVVDGTTFEIGAVRFRAMHTPGHTPEHLSFLVTDTAAGDRPMGAFTGDFIFVGDVGRPDLLERAVKVTGTMEASARQLFASIQRFKSLPDYLQLWPGHGAGSACGKSLSAMPQSTLGYERLFNWGLALTDEDEFVEAVLAGQPDPPTYFAMMKSINRIGPRLRGAIQRPLRVGVEQARDALSAGAVVVDTRPAAGFAAGHIPGSLNIPLNRSFSTWAGWLLPYDRDIYLVADDRRGQGVTDAVRDLAMIGLDRIVGYVGTNEVERWTASNRSATVRQVNTAELAERLRTGDAVVVDVRAPTEYSGGRLPGSVNIPLGQLAEKADAMPRDHLIVVQCQSGGRSAIAASVLASRGIDNVADLVGGIDAWKAGGYPVAAGAA
ncbi:MAG: MBL fold metallo-hydrolase [Gemmatimonadales bacterium]|nr:MBL fold metallo-hydrolase [Gemmatimonadales bacterium]